MVDSTRSWLRWVFAALLVLVAADARSALPQAADEAAVWLESAQNADGSWGSTRDIQPLFTSEAVVALRATGRRGTAYYRGIAWLENRAMTSADSQARRIVALLPNGDDVSLDQSRLAAGFSTDGYYGDGWGLAGVHGPSAIDTGLALIAFGALGVPASVQANAVAGTGFLLNTQVTPGGGWKGAIATANAASDPVTTAIVLRGYAAVRNYITGHVASGNTAQSYLLSAVVPASTALQKAQAALAVLRWTPGTTSADTWLNNLDATQATDGSWGQDPYATAVALQALAAKLGRDAPTLQTNIVIQDLGLRAAINLALGKNRVDAITRGEMQSLRSLEANAFRIANLDGIQEAINLTDIFLVGNQIVDLTPLNSLPYLTTIVLAEPCDLDADGAITLRDAQRALRASARYTVLNQNELAAADVVPLSSPDGQVTAGDATAVLRASAGWIVQACGN